MKRLSFQLDAFKSSLKIIKKNWLPASMTIFTIIVMLALASIFGMFSNIIHKTDLDWHNTKQITLYLKVPTSALEEQQTLDKIRATEGVDQASLRTAADALMFMQEELGMYDVIGYLENNPLPAAIDVIPGKNIDTNKKLNSLFKVLQSYPNVDVGKMDIESIRRISLFMNVISNILEVVICLIVIALVLVIASSLRLIISDRVEEISVLKFIGASDRFIRRPYLYIGILYGLLSSGLTIIIVNTLFFSMRTQVNKLLTNYAISYEAQALSGLDSVMVVFIALMIGLFGAWIATQRYLKCPAN